MNCTSVQSIVTIITPHGQPKNCWFIKHSKLLHVLKLVKLHECLRDVWNRGRHQKDFKMNTCRWKMITGEYRNIPFISMKSIRMLPWQQSLHLSAWLMCAVPQNGIILLIHVPGVLKIVLLSCNCLSMHYIQNFCFFFATHWIIRGILLFLLLLLLVLVVVVF